MTNFSTRRDSRPLERIRTLQQSRCRLWVVLLLLLTPTWMGCGNDTLTPTAPTPTAAGPTPTAPTLPTWPMNRFIYSLTGNLTLTRSGETSQLTVTETTVSDNTTRDVTAQCVWRIDSKVATISQTGLLTAVGFGASEISCQYANDAWLYGYVTFTPHGTFAIGGRVSEPDNSDFYFGVVANALVVDTLSGRSATTDSQGRFLLGQLRSLPAHLKLEKGGFEPAEVDVTGPIVELPMQPIVRLVAGETVTPIALVQGHDVSYAVGGTRCFPCRLIRVVVPRPGTVRVRVSWTELASKLTLFVEGQVVAGGTSELTADVPINAPREVLVYVGGALPKAVFNYAAFTFETSFH